MGSMHRPLKVPATPVAVGFVYTALFPFKKMQYGINLTNYTPTANTTVTLMFYCDGINCYCYINEVA